MAAQPGGIAALSMYNDDDDEEEEEEQQQQQEDDLYDPRNPNPPSPILRDDGLAANSDTLIGSMPATPPLAPSQLASQRTRRGALTIVDYAHDEFAVSPDRAGGLKSSKRWNVESPPKTFENFERSEPDASNSNQESSRNEEIGPNSSNPRQEDDLLLQFLGPPVESKCKEELQLRINKFIALKRSGRSFNDDLRNRKNYRNPDFLQHAVGYQGIDQIGSCFNKDVFDPHGYDKSDFYDEIDADMKREIERKEQERKRSPKIDFFSGGTQTVPLVPILKTSGLPQAPLIGDAAPREARNKKSKWDKVESDVVQTQHENSSQAASIGTGYSGFAQQKRKEAEEKKASDRRS